MSFRMKYLLDNVRRPFVIILFTACLLSPVVHLQAQKHPISPSQVAVPFYFGKSSPLKDLPALQPTLLPGDQNGGEIENTNIRKDNFAAWPKIIDPVLQTIYPGTTPAQPRENFEGLNNLQNKIPPDTEGDVGKNHYIQMVNMSFAVYDKTGKTLYGPATNLSLWQEAPEIWASYSNGDPIVLYDECADRWLMSELSFPNHPHGPYYFKLAVSETNDPLGAWYLYGYEYKYFCDYPKLSVWNNGYYLTTNNNVWINSQWDFHAVGVSVFERDSLLAGSPHARRIFFDLFPNQQLWSMLPADFDGAPPPAESPALLACLRAGSTDRIFLYQVTTDWQQVNNSELSYLNTLFPESFDDNMAGGITQPDNAPTLDAMTNRLMYRLQYRHFGNYDCLIANHTVNRGDGVAGIRWYEFRNPGSGWYIHQQGTYAPDHSHRWMGSAAMDGYGNIAVGFSRSGIVTYPSIGVAGRTSEAPPGQFDVAELSVINGSGVQTNPNHRWGDYSAMQIDPADQTTFWYTQQYYETTGDRSWQTRVAAFHINDYLELSLSAARDTICGGDALQLYATVAGGSGSYRFSWRSIPAGFASVGQNPFAFPDTNTLYFCTLHDGVNQITDSVGVVVNPAANISAGPDTTICTGDPFQPAAAYAENIAGVWWVTTGDGTFDYPENIRPLYTPGAADIANGTVSLTLNGYALSHCADTSATMQLFIDPCTGINSLNGAHLVFDVFPNPAGQKLTIRLQDIPSQKHELLVFSLSGKLMKHYNLPPNRHTTTFTVDVSDMKTGVYLVRLHGGGITAAKRIVIHGNF